MRTKTVTILLVFIAVIGSAFLFDHRLPAQTASPDTTSDSTKVKMRSQVSAIFKADCSLAGCHRGAYPKKNLNLESDKFLKSVLNVTSQEIGTLKLVDAQNPEKSYLLMKIRKDKGIKGSRMPDGAPPLKKEEIKTIEDWIFSLKESNPEKAKNPTPPDTTKNFKSNR